MPECGIGDDQDSAMKNFGLQHYRSEAMSGPSASSKPPLADISLNVRELMEEERREHKRNVDAQKASIETAKQIQLLNQRLDKERKERLESEKVNTRFQWVNTILVALTLLATIFFGLGLHSCSSTFTGGTNATQESGAVASNSAPEKTS